MSEELKLCPFCGREPEIEYWSGDWRMYTIKCNNQDCPVPVVAYPIGHDFDEVLAKWNGEV